MLPIMSRHSVQSAVQTAFFPQFIYNILDLCYYYWKLITSVNLLYDALLHFRFQLALYLSVSNIL